MDRKMIAVLLLLIIAASGCAADEKLVSRQESIPADAVKMTPATDEHPPVLHSEDYETPVPFDAINTAGGEDSPFIASDSDDLYFFFTPDVSIPAEKQVIDEVTGIYVSRYADGGYQEPERVVLQDPGKLSLEGCAFVSGNFMLFCTAREGYTGIHWFSAEYVNGKWANWKNADFDPAYEVGELHISGDNLYFHSSRAGGKGGLDIWISKKANGEWQPPENVEAVNTQGDEGWPYVSPDGNELWFTRTYMGSPAIYRSLKANDQWQEPELMVSQFAGEPTLDSKGNLYFVHHYYSEGEMIEADIYVAYKK